MICTVQQALAQDTKWLGYLEKASAADLDDKTANPGTGNFQRFQPICRAGNGDQWCQYYVAGTTIEACGGSVDDARTVLRIPANAEITGYTPTAMGYYVQAGAYFNIPEVGDQVFFYVSSKGRVGHTGRVKSVDRANKTFVSTEGNTSSDTFDSNGGCVAEHEYSYATVGGTNRVNGFGRPAYAKEATEAGDMWESDEEHKEWIRQMYVDYLHRLPSDDELARDLPKSLKGLIYKLRTSTEGRTDWTTGCYLKYLHRAPKSDEVKRWLDAMIINGAKRSTVMDRIERSEEARTKQG